MESERERERERERVVEVAVLAKLANRLELPRFLIVPRDYS